MIILIVEASTYYYFSVEYQTIGKNVVSTQNANYYHRSNI